MFSHIIVKHIIDGLNEMERGFASTHIQELLNEYNRLNEIFLKLDKLYKPHTQENPFGLMDSPQSLISQTREAIDFALNKN